MTGPTREQVQEALHAIDDEGSDFVIRPIRWPWNHLVAAARLWLDLDQQINQLANFIMAEIPGEPSQSEGAVDTAMRWMSSRLVDEAMIERAALLLCDYIEDGGEHCGGHQRQAERVLRAALEVSE